MPFPIVTKKEQWLHFESTIIGYQLFVSNRTHSQLVVLKKLSGVCLESLVLTSFVRGRSTFALTPLGIEYQS